MSRFSIVVKVEDLFVDEAQRRQGIATRAPELAEEYAYSLPGVEAAILDALPRNEVALRLHRKLGYDPLCVATLRKRIRPGSPRHGLRTGRAGFPDVRALKKAVPGGQQISPARPFYLFQRYGPLFFPSGLFLAPSAQDWAGHYSVWGLIFYFGNFVLPLLIIQGAGAVISVPRP